MPRTLAQNAQYIAETIKPAIKSAIEAQGVTVPSTDSFLDYADRIGEIEGGGSGYQLKDLPTGAISTVNDAAELPLNALKVSVEAWQEGSGDPSPSNVRPIHGWDSGEIGVVGKNFFADTIIAYSSQYLTTNGFYVKPGQYTFKFLNASEKQIAYWASEDSNITDQNIKVVNAGSTATTSYTVTGQGLVKFSFRYSPVESGILPTVISQVMFCKSDDIPTTYEPYQGKRYTQQFPQTVYGAEWDVVGGVLSQTDGYIASYNGESLPSTWISDRDVYASGTTPTIGAEVVYKLATPTTIDLSPLSIRMLQGTNNLYADCGEVIEGEYFSGSAKGYVDGIKYAGEGDGGIASYTNVKSADELLGASAITFEVYARIDSYVSKTSGAYARLMEFGNSQQTGRLGFIGLASDNDNNLCYWDDTADIASGIDTWTLGDTHLVSIVKTTAGALKIYVDGVLKYTGASTLTITSSIIDYVALRGIYAQPSNTGRQLNGEVYTWRVYAKELSAANIAQNLTADRSLYSR